MHSISINLATGSGDEGSQSINLRIVGERLTDADQQPARVDDQFNSGVLRGDISSNLGSVTILDRSGQPVTLGGLRDGEFVKITTGSGQLKGSYSIKGSISIEQR